VLRACTAPIFVELLAGNLPAGIVHTGHRAIGFEQNAGPRPPSQFANGAPIAEADVVGRPPTASTPSCGPHVFPPSTPVVSRHHFPIAGLIAPRAPAGLAHGPLADVGRSVEAFSSSSRFRPRHDGQLRRLRAGRRGDEGIVVRAGRSGAAAPRVRRLGPAHRRRSEAGRQKPFRWALYDREPLPGWTKGRLTLLGRCRASDAAASGARAPTSRSRTAWRLATILAQGGYVGRFQRLSLLTSGCVAKRVAEVQLGARKHGLRGGFGPPAISVSGDRELAAQRGIQKAALQLRRGFPSFHQGSLPRHLAHALELLADLGPRAAPARP